MTTAKTIDDHNDLAYGVFNADDEILAIFADENLAKAYAARHGESARKIYIDFDATSRISW